MNSLEKRKILKIIPQQKNLLVIFSKITPEEHKVK
jgi:hypothetical protein